MNILKKIIHDKRIEIVGRKNVRPIDVLQEQARLRKKVPDFIAPLTSVPVGLVAEIKHMSPSAGIIRDPFDPPRIGESYAAAGVQAVSVLLDEKYFDGGERDFQLVRSAIKTPMLYKEFVIDPWQVWHAASLGASAVLLIAAVLRQEEFASLIAVCREAGIEPLMEVHDEEEMRRAADTDVRCIGINNRDLKTFKVSLEVTLRMKDRAPAGSTLISESGIKTHRDIRQLQGAGVDAVLVGEYLLRQPDITAAVNELMGW